MPHPRGQVFPSEYSGSCTPRCDVPSRESVIPPTLPAWSALSVPSSRPSHLCRPAVPGTSATPRGWHAPRRSDSGTGRRPVGSEHPRHTPDTLPSCTLLSCLPTRHAVLLSGRGSGSVNERNAESGGSSFTAGMIIWTTFPFRMAENESLTAVRDVSDTPSPVTTAPTVIPPTRS